MRRALQFWQERLAVCNRKLAITSSQLQRYKKRLERNRNSKRTWRHVHGLSYEQRRFRTRKIPILQRAVAKLINRRLFLQEQVWRGFNQIEQMKNLHEM